MENGGYKQNLSLSIGDLMMMIVTWLSSEACPFIIALTPGKKFH